MKTLFYNRSFSLLLSQPSETVTFTPEKYSYNAIGGPERCTINGTGTRGDLWNMINLLGFPLEIYDDNGQILWWGYLGQCQIKDGLTTADASLSKMANSVRVAYTTSNDDGSINERLTTVTATNTQSISAFGTKEVILSLSRASDLQATTYRDSYIAQSAKPSIEITQSGNSAGALSATYTGFGYWNWLGWRYYSNAGTALVDTATQAGTILAAQSWVAGVVVETASGITSNQFRAGDNTARTEVENLLKTGTSNNRRLLSFVSPARIVTVSEEPAVPTEAFYYQHPDGHLSTTYSEYQDPQIFQAGYFVDRSAIIPPEANTNNFSGRIAFIDRTEYDIKTKRLIRLEPRDTITANDLFRTREG